MPSDAVKYYLAFLDEQQRDAEFAGNETLAFKFSQCRIVMNALAEQLDTSIARNRALKAGLTAQGRNP